MTDAPDGSLATDEERATLLAAYDAQLRGEAEVQGAVSWDRSGPLWRALFQREGFVSYESLEGLGSLEAVDNLIAETVAFFAGNAEIERFEWKTRGHDWPSDLDERLRAQGLEAEEVETVMVGEASHLAVDVELPEGVTVRRVDQLPEREAIVTEASDVAAKIFGDGPSGAEMLDRLDRMNGLEQFWVAEAATDGGSHVVCSGRLALVAGTRVRGRLGRVHTSRVAREGHLPGPHGRACPRRPGRRRPVHQQRLHSDVPADPGALRAGRGDHLDAVRLESLTPVTPRTAGAAG